MSARKHVALLIETSTTWGSDLIRGIMRYARHHTDWVVHFEPRGKYEVLTPPQRWSGQGLIARITTAALAEYISALGLATVNVSWYRHEHTADRIAHCTTDVREAGRMCASHFLERGFRHFAYCGALHRPNYDDDLAHSFCTVLGQQGYDCAVFESGGMWQQNTWQIEYTELRDWLRGLPQPTGLLAFDSVRGRQITEVCRAEGIRVPEQVAVLAGEHDDLCCVESIPPLSTLDIAPRRVGYKAAAMLDQMLSQDELRVVEQVKVAPGRLTVRQSSDTLAIEDPDIAVAVRFIRQNACESIQVKDVLRQVPLSRRALEQRFKALTGRTPAAEIRHAKIEIARKLLEETDLRLATIAQRTGFRHPEVLIRVFQRETGLSPTAYRSQNQLRARGQKIRIDHPASGH